MFVAWVFIVVSSLFVLLGLLIWRFKFVSLIAGSDSAKVTDKEALARWFGCTVGITGLIGGCIGMINLVYDSERIETLSCISLMFLILFMSVAALIGYQKYSH